MPVLEALGRLCRAPDGTSLLALLNQHAPTWLAQLPALLNPTELTQLQQRVQGANRQRMLRELADALEVLTSDHPLVLVLEDLHWSDVSTLEFLAYLARRQEQTRLMMIGTYRPSDLPRAHPLPKLTHELHVRGLCRALSLQPLKRADVATYVATRFPGTAGVDALATVIHRRTEGNALFMVTTVQALTSQGLMVEKAGRWELQVSVDALPVPESLRQVIAQQLERLGGEKRQVLEAASVEGVECTAAAIAAAVGRDTIAIEECCADLVRGHFLCDRGISEWPDGTGTARFGFVHALYQEVLYEHVLPAKRTQFHRRIGERLAHGYGEHAQEIAAELALHFARGRDYPRALQYCHQAAEVDLQRCAYPEAIGHLTRGLQLLRHIPSTLARVQHELRLQLNLGVSMMATKGYAAPEAQQAYNRAYDLCQQVGESPHLLTVLRGLGAFYFVRADLQTMRDLAERCLALALQQHDPVQLLGTHLGLGAALFSLGDFVQARLHLEQGVALYDPQQHSTCILLYGYNLGVACLARLAMVLWLLGYPEQALKKSQQALELAREPLHPFSLAYALMLATECHWLRREAHATREQAEATIALATAQGFPLWEAGANIVRGWALAEHGQVAEGIGQLRHGIAAWQDTGAAIVLPAWLAQLAEAYGQAGQIEEGLATLTTALATIKHTGETWWEAEVHRLQGEFILQKFQVSDSSSQIDLPQSAICRPQLEAGACFLKAIEIARRQQAKSLELRAVVSLSRLWQKQGKKVEAHKMLVEIYGWFTEGLKTKDLQETEALLAQLREEEDPIQSF